MKHWRKLLSLGTLSLVASMLLAVPVSKGQGRDEGVLIVASASIKGEVTPCG